MIGGSCEKASCQRRRTRVNGLCSVGCAQLQSCAMRAKVCGFLSIRIRKRRCVAGWNKEWKRLVRLGVCGEETQSWVLSSRSEFAVTERWKVQGCDRHSSFMPSHNFEGPSETRLVKVIVSFDLLLSQASCFLFIKTRIAILTLFYIVSHRLIHNKQ